MNVLVATDGSRYAISAARFLAKYGRIADATIDLVSVKSKEAPHDPRQSLDQTAKVFARQPTRINTITRQGEPAQVLAKLAQKNDYDLCVIGAKGRGNVPFFDIGSVALMVAEHVPTNVLMVREAAAKARHQQRRTALSPFRLLVPTDGQPHSAAAIDGLFELLEFPHAQADVLTVLDAAELRMLRRLSDTQRERFLKKIRAEAQETLDQAAGHLGQYEIPVETAQAEGDPAERIVEQADKLGSDLLVLGSRGVKHLEERHLGSTALEVARSSPCSVLIVRNR